LYVDEFQNFANESFADILSEARKYKLGLTVAHQYIEQMSEEVRAAVFGNVGSMISFRVGAFDSEIMEKEFAPQFTAEDMVNLGFCQIYLKLMIDGISSPPFSATTLPPIKKEEITYVPQIVESSRQNFSRPRAQVEEEIKNWHMPVGSVPPAQNGGAPASGMSRPVASVGAPMPRTASRTDSPRPPERRQEERPKESRDQRERSPEDARRAPRPQTFSQAGSNPIRPKDHSSREVRENRETELRKAMSLDYLKQKPEPEKKKEVNPENVAELRNALLSVLKDVPGAATIPPAAAPTSAPATPVAPAQPAAPAATVTTTTIKNEVVQETISIPPKPTAQMSKAETKPELKAEIKQEIKKEGPQEVPEEVLRKLLHVDPDDSESL